MYWAFITSGPRGAAQGSVFVRSLWPAPIATATVTGTVEGSGSSPGWPGTTITVYRGSLPVSLATGNGTYLVALGGGAVSSFAGQDPWASAAPGPPLAEGASIVMLYAGVGTTAVYDSGLAGATFGAGSGLSYTLALPSPAPGSLTLWDSIGADGQHHGGATGGPNSRTAVTSVSDEKTTINAVAVAGPGSAYNDGDWNGADSLPIPSLWDTSGHTITAATPFGTTLLDVTIASATSPGPGIEFDLLTPVANLVTLS